MLLHHRLFILYAHLYASVLVHLVCGYALARAHAHTGLGRRISARAHAHAGSGAPAPVAAHVSAHERATHTHIGGGCTARRQAPWRAGGTRRTGLRGGRHTAARARTRAGQAHKGEGSRHTSGGHRRTHARGAEVGGASGTGSERISGWTGDWGRHADLGVPTAGDSPSLHEDRGARKNTRVRTGGRARGKERRRGSLTGLGKYHGCRGRGNPGDKGGEREGGNLVVSIKVVDVEHGESAEG